MKTLQDLKEIFKVSRFTIYRWMECGELHGIKIGRKWYYTDEEIERIKKEGIKIGEKL